MTTIAHDQTRRVTGGVDTHKDLHVAAVLDDLGRLLGTASFPTTRHGYRRLLAWLPPRRTIVVVMPKPWSSGSPLTSMPLTRNSRSSR